MPSPLWARARGAAAALALCALLTGCGGGNSKVSGKVKVAGRPVVWGSVTLVDQKGQYHQGDIDLNGNYTIDGVPSGAVKIGVASPSPTPPPGRPPAGAPTKGAPSDDAREKFLAEKGLKQNTDDRPRPPAGAWFPIDLKFSDPTSSGLSGEVKAGTSELNIDVK